MIHFIIKASYLSQRIKRLESLYKPIGVRFKIEIYSKLLDLPDAQIAVETRPELPNAQVNLWIPTKLRMR